MISSQSLLKSLLWRFLLFSFILIAGAYIFICLEKRSNEDKHRAREKLRDINRSLLIHHNISVGQLLQYSESIRLQQIELEELSILMSIYMCTTIAFTTGSGHVVPTTRASKIFFIFYSIVSSAITTLTLVCIGEIIQQTLRKCVIFFERYINHKSSTQRGKNLSLKCCLVCVVLLVMSIVVNSAMLTRYGFQLLDAAYYTIQIWTTIGFGDVPMTHDLYEYVEKGYLIFVLPSTMIGLSLLAAVINGLVKIQSMPFPNSIKKRITHKDASIKSTVANGNIIKNRSSQNNKLPGPSTSKIPSIS